MKAFLSHSSIDKEFVKAVAKELGRQYCVFDEQVFTTGEELKAAIERGLDASSVFVLFASSNALKSIWVNFEQQEAWYQKLHGTLSKSLVYIIDSNVKPGDLPNWLQRAIVRHETSPKIIARDIRNHLDELLRERQHPYFVGRSKEIEELEQYLMPIDGATPPRAIFVTGLPGVGRRSVARNAASSILNLKKHIEIRIGEGDSTNDICIRVADHVETYSTDVGFERIIKNIRSLTDQEATLRILDYLRIINDAGELPIFFDDGGLIDNEGYLREPVETILRALAPVENVYIFLVSSRKPVNSYSISIPVLYLKPLNQNEIKRLISMLANQSGYQLSTGNISQLSEYVAGYPPAAYFAVQQVKYYGIDLVLADKYRLVQFRTSVFLRHLTNLKLSPNAQNILRLLAFYSPLPFNVIVNVLKEDLNVIQEVITQLIDFALIIVNEDGYYRIADPVTGAAENVFGFLSLEQHKSVTRELSTYLSGKQSRDFPRLELSSVLYRAALMAKEEETANAAFHFANDLIQLTEQFYHARNYEDAIKYGRLALKERPDSHTARSYLIRALIQEEKWQEAEEMLDEMESHAPLSDVYFLTGFLERKRGRIPAALMAYTEAQKTGRHDVALLRELAQCYFLEGDLEQASKFITEALEIHNDNNFLIDIWAQIATSQGDEVTARKALKRLEITGKPVYYHHRASRIALIFGHLMEAVDEATMAYDLALSENYVPFEVLAQLINCEIDTDNLVDAEKHLSDLDQRFRIHRDIRIALRCRFEIARGKYSEALHQSQRIEDKRSLIYKKIRHDAIAGELSESSLRDNVRALYEDELMRLERELAEIKSTQLLPGELDDVPL